MDFLFTLPLNEMILMSGGRNVEIMVSAAWGGTRHIQSEGTMPMQLIVLIGESQDFPSFYRFIFSHDQNNPCAHFRNP